VNKKTAKQILDELHLINKIIQEQLEIQERLLKLVRGRLKEDED